ncbi:MAG TPA: HEAT repeat domain-containing protein [Gemmatimonadaceae bacterium]
MLTPIISLAGLTAVLSSPVLVLLIKATVILLAALGITIAMQRRSAGARHLVWLVALAALLVVPAIAAWAPLRIEVLPADSISPAAEPVQTVQAPVAPKTLGDAPVAGTTAPTPSAAPGGAAQPATSSIPLWLDGVSLVVAIWAVVMLAIGATLLWSALVVRRIVRHASPLAGEGWTTPLFEVADRLELDDAPRLLCSEDAKMPFACGLFAPTIVLPADCDGWSMDRRRAVLLHELAHVRRHDLLGHTLGRIACAVWWFHPLVWTAAKQLRAESERACDDLALSCGTRATDYAEHLLDIVTSVRGDATPHVALAMARRKEFEGRMLAILDPELQRATPGRLQAIGLAASLVVIALVVGAASPMPRQAMAQDVARRDSVETRRPRREADVQRIVDHATRQAMRDTDRSVSTRTNTVTSTVTNTVQQTVKNVVPSVVESVVRGLVGDSESGASATARATAQAKVGQLSPEGLRALIKEGMEQDRPRGHDDRPALLANVLKTDQNPELRRVAAWGLNEYADQQVAAEALVAALRGDKDADVREMAAWSLGESHGTTAVVSALGDAAKSDASEKVRATATWALGSIGSSSGAPALIALLTDRSPEIRRRAAWSLGTTGVSHAPPALLEMLKDPDPEVRSITAWALYQIEDPAAAPALQAALKAEKDENLQIEYIRALASTGEKSVDALRELLQSSDPRVKSMAVHALAGTDATGPWPWPWPEPRPYP